MSNTTVRFMQGNDALVEGAIAAGARFFAGYPITPASEITEGMSVRLPLVGGVFLQMEDEIASMGAAIGASMAGAKCLTATSGPGFSLKQEGIGIASMMEIPVVIVDVMRGGPASGMSTLPSQMDVMQARWGCHGDHPIIVLSPATVTECYELAIKAFNLAELIRQPVIILSDAIVGHLRERIDLPDPSAVKVIDRKMTTKSPEEYAPFEAEEDLLKVSGIGISEAVSGGCVYVIVPHLGIKRTFYIDEDSHTFTRNSHKMTLKLNFADDIDSAG